MTLQPKWKTTSYTLTLSVWEREMDSQNTHPHTHTFTLVPFLAWTYTPSYTDGYPFPMTKPHQLVKWHNKLVHFHDCAENNQIWCQSISPDYICKPSQASLSLSYTPSPLSLQLPIFMHSSKFSFQWTSDFISHKLVIYFTWLQKEGMFGSEFDESGWIFFFFFSLFIVFYGQVKSQDSRRSYLRLWCSLLSLSLSISWAI